VPDLYDFVLLPGAVFVEELPELVVRVELLLELEPPELDERLEPLLECELELCDDEDE
jgi:hypothetical protein